MGERLTVDVAGMIAAAMEKKQAEVVAYWTDAGQTPAGEVLTWKTTPEQVARINAGDRAALDAFYFDNLQRLTFSALRYMRNNAYVQAVVSYEDLIQQVYVDLRAGILKLRPFDKAICKAVFTSFRFAAVGGLDELYIYEDKKGRA